MLIIHHKDEDGRCAAAIVARYLERLPQSYPYELHETDYDQKEPPWERIERHYGNVWILDFSYPPDVMKALYNRYGDKIIWIDHHITAVRGITDPFKGSRDPLKSSCLLAWEYLHINSPVPDAVELISQYDTGNFTPLSKQFMKALAMRDQHPANEMWRELLEYRSTRSKMIVEQFITEGKLLIHYQLQQNKELIRQYGTITELGGYKAMKLNAPLRADVLEASLECYPDVPIAWIWTEYETREGRAVRKNTLYSNTINVGEIAKSLGGGGHKGAAGFIEFPSPQRDGQSA